MRDFVKRHGIRIIHLAEVLLTPTYEIVTFQGLNRDGKASILCYNVACHNVLVFIERIQYIT